MLFHKGKTILTQFRGAKSNQKARWNWWR